MSLRVTDHLGNIFHQQKQVMRVGRAGLKIEVLIKLAGLFILGVNEQSAYPDDIRRRNTT